MFQDEETFEIRFFLHAAKSFRPSEDKGSCRPGIRGRCGRRLDRDRDDFRIRIRAFRRITRQRIENVVKTFSISIEEEALVIAGCRHGMSRRQQEEGDSLIRLPGMNDCDRPVLSVRRRANRLDVPSQVDKGAPHTPPDKFHPGAFRRHPLADPAEIEFMIRGVSLRIDLGPGRDAGRVAVKSPEAGQPSDPRIEGSPRLRAIFVGDGFRIDAQRTGVRVDMKLGIMRLQDLVCRRQVLAECSISRDMCHGSHEKPALFHRGFRRKRRRASRYQ